MPRLRRLAAFLGLRASTAGLLGVVVLVGMGEHMAERFLPIYILALGGGALAVGVLSAMDNLLSALYSWGGGWLAQRFGAKRALLLVNLLVICGYLIVILVPRWEAVLAGAVLFIAWTAVSLPASMTVIADVLPRDKRTMGVTMHSLVRRLPMALGPVLGGVAIGVFGEEAGVRVAFGAALVLAVVAIVVQQVTLPDDRPAPQAHGPGVAAGFRLLRGPLRTLLVSDILVRFCEQIPKAFVVVWAMKVIAEPVSAVAFGWLTALEMATAILIYLPVAHFADRLGKKPFVVATFVFFTAFPLILLRAQSLEWLILAFFMRGMKEFGEPTRKSLILDLAPEGRKAETFGVYYLIRDVFVSAAALGGAWLWTIDPAVNLWTAAGFGVAGTLLFAAFGSDVSAAPGSAPAAPATLRPDAGRGRN